MKNYIEIRDVWARQILDSRGNPTVEVEVYLVDGTIATITCELTGVWNIVR